MLIQNCQKVEMAAKVFVLEFMAFTLALTMFRTHHQAYAKEDCYAEKAHVIDECFDFLRRYGSTSLTSLDCSPVLLSRTWLVYVISSMHMMRREYPQRRWFVLHA
jgi:hypothetical protein